MEALFGFSLVPIFWYGTSRYLKGKGAGAFKRHFLGLIAGLLAMLFFAAYMATHPSTPRTTSAAPSSASNAPAAAPQPQPAVKKVTAENLFEDYHANEVSADQWYKGQRLQVSGKVQSIEKDAFNNIVIHLTTSNQFSAVWAYLDSEHEAVAARLAKGDKVKFICTGEGMVIGSPILKKCSPV